MARMVISKGNDDRSGWKRYRIAQFGESVSGKIRTGRAQARTATPFAVWGESIGC